MHLRLGREPVALPEPLAGLVVHLAARRRGHAAHGDQGTSPWLFPGGRPGQPISAYQLAERMRQLGLRPAQNRSTALFGLATELPPPCSPGCPASTSKSPSNGNEPPPATGPPTPPTTAAANQPLPKTPNRHFGTQVSETHSDSRNNRVHQVAPGYRWTATRPTSSSPASPELPARPPAPPPGRRPACQADRCSTAGQASIQARSAVAAGRIGSAVLRRLKPFDVTLHYTDVHRLPENVERELGVIFYESAADMVPHCDVVTINAPLYPGTEGLFNDQLISTMRRGAYIVNTARAKICDRAAIARALDSGQLAGYAGDVWFPQPAPRGSPVAHDAAPWHDPAHLRVVAVGAGTLRRGHLRDPRMLV